MPESINLLDETRRLLIEKYPEGGYNEFIELGERLNLSWRWFYRLRAGELRDAKSDTIQKVYEDLSGKHLVV